MQTATTATAETTTTTTITTTICTGTTTAIGQALIEKQPALGIMGYFSYLYYKLPLVKNTQKGQISENITVSRRQLICVYSCIGIRTVGAR